MSFFTNLYDILQKDEQWVVTELQKAYLEVQTAGKIIKADVNGVISWIKAHQSQLQAIMITALQGVAIAGGVPQLAPLVPIATTALDASEAIIDTLSKAAVGDPGNVTLSDLANGYHTVIDARNAVSAVLKAATSPAS